MREKKAGAIMVRTPGIIDWQTKMATEGKLTEIAKKSKIPRSYLSHYIRGRMNLTPGEKARVARALNMPIHECFTDWGKF